MSPKENGRVKDENSINSSHGRRVAKKVDDLLVARAGKVVGKDPYEAGDGEVIEKYERRETGSLLQSEWWFCRSLYRGRFLFF